MTMSQQLVGFQSKALPSGASVGQSFSKSYPFCRSKQPFQRAKAILLQRQKAAFTKQRQPFEKRPVKLQSTTSTQASAGFSTIQPLRRVLA